MDEVVLKRGRGRPPGSLNRPKAPTAPTRSPEQAEALKRRLAGAYAEAVAGHALAADRKRRVRASIKLNFGSGGFQEVEEFIHSAAEQLIPDASDDPDLELSTASS